MAYARGSRFMRISPLALLLFNVDGTNLRSLLMELNIERTTLQSLHVDLNIRRTLRSLHVKILIKQSNEPGMGNIDGTILHVEPNIHETTLRNLHVELNIHRTTLDLTIYIITLRSLHG